MITPLGSLPVGPSDNLHHGDDPSDARLLAEVAGQLAAGIDAALPGWVERSVLERAEAWRPGLGAELRPAAAAAGRAARDEVGPLVRALLEADVDQQRTGPLAVIRTAVRHPTEVLAAAGVPPVVRDEFAVRTFPEDRYSLAPASFADLDPALAEVGMVWGAAKAHVVRHRHHPHG